MSSDASDPIESAFVNKPDTREPHHPVFRHARQGWWKDAEGRWVSVAEDPSRWEVVCPQCGDSDGPADNQLPRVITLRGPYASRHKAERAAKRHLRECQASHRLHGNTTPNK